MFMFSSYSKHLPASLSSRILPFGFLVLCLFLCGCRGDRPSGRVPGVVVCHYNQQDSIYIGSPSLCILLHHPDRGYHGFQYADWLFDGDDLVFLSRTAYDDERTGANNFHNSNYLTFHRIEAFRDALTEQIEDH